MEPSPQPTDRSPTLLLSFPQEILQLVFTEYLADELYSGENGKKFIYKRLSRRVIEFRYLVHGTSNLRGVCFSWATAARSLVFRDKSSREGLIPRLPRLFTEEEIRIFPDLKDCMVSLCHPYWLDELASLQIKLADLTLDYVCAIVWREDDVMDIMRGRVGHMGYGRIESRIVDTFVAEALAGGVNMVDYNGKRPNHRGADSIGNEELEEAAARAVKNFILKETLALWYYNAHMARQVLSEFPCLTILELPDFLHLPLLANMKYFFPPFLDNDESPFSHLSFAPPQMLQELGLNYRQQGRSYMDLMAPIEHLRTLTNHYNPILALLHGLVPSLGPPTLWSLRIMNKWRSNNVDWDIGAQCREVMESVIEEAVTNIPDNRKPAILDTQLLMSIFDMDLS